jgi:hypothetical protein
VAIVQADARTDDRTIVYTLKDYHVLKGADVPHEAVQLCKLVLVDAYEPDATIAMLEAVPATGQRSVLDLEIVDRDTDRDKISAMSAGLGASGAENSLPKDRVGGRSGGAFARRQ